MRFENCKCVGIEQDCPSEISSHKICENMGSKHDSLNPKVSEKHQRTNQHHSYFSICFTISISTCVMALRQTNNNPLSHPAQIQSSTCTSLRSSAFRSLRQRIFQKSTITPKKYRIFFRLGLDKPKGQQSGDISVSNHRNLLQKAAFINQNQVQLSKNKRMLHKISLPA